MHRSRRMRNLKPYPFAKMAEAIASLRARGTEVIRMDIGSPDMPPADHILAAAERAVRDPRLHGYPAFGYGTPSLLEAVSEYYQRRFQVPLDPKREVTALIGSKEGIFHLAQALLEPGDVALIPDPGYPVYRIAVEWAGAEAHLLPLKRENGFLPDWNSIPAEVLARTRMLWLNYPNNPTGAVAGREFYAGALDFARRNGILLCHDAAYCDVAFDGFLPMSVLELPDAKSCAVEFTSVSKTYNMAGWRLGFLSGNSEAVSALRRLKGNVDSGIFPAVAAAGEAALRGDQTWLAARNAIYARRGKRILEGLAAAGLRAEPVRASMYIWASVPRGSTAAAFADAFLRETGVCFAPGTFFGGEGEGYLRISLATPTERVEQAVGRMKEWNRNG
ncbi:MAG: aminotransferase class I/II-fold pyridoxal phosphate-dependent enzyme [Anaerolineales bacterium]|nr:aminotransferase class I/II-fold pyridoxal phosphate-dependent enzyme [Anaerolineales bacterium]